MGNGRNRRNVQSFATPLFARVFWGSGVAETTLLSSAMCVCVCRNRKHGGIRFAGTSRMPGALPWRCAGGIQVHAPPPTTFVCTELVRHWGPSDLAIALPCPTSPPPGQIGWAVANHGM